MRISDWSSDVCSSDLGVAQDRGLAPFGMFEITGAGVIMAVAGIACLLIVGRWLLPDRQVLSGILPRSQDRHFMADVLAPLGSPLDRKSVVLGKCVSVRVDHGGRRFIKKTNTRLYLLLFYSSHYFSIHIFLLSL